MTKKLKFGELLVQNKIITLEQLERALEEQKKTGEMIGVTLQRLGFVDEESLYMPILAQQIGVEFVRLKDVSIPTEIIKKIPAKFAIHYKVVPLKFENNVLSIAMTRPLDIHLLDEVSLIVEEMSELVAVAALKEAVFWALAGFWPFRDSISRVLWMRMSSR